MCRPPILFSRLGTTSTATPGQKEAERSGYFECEHQANGRQGLQPVLTARLWHRLGCAATG